MATPEVTIEPATLEDAFELAEVMRPGDREECEALGGSGLDHIILSVEKSSVSYTVRFDGEVAAMYGAGPADDTILCSRGIVWLLTGGAVARHPKAFLKIARACLAELMALYPRLEILVDARYAAALRFVRWLGFSVGQVRALGPAQTPFHRIWIGGAHG